MPIYHDKESGCWRFSFNRVINGKRFRATKLLPKGWTKTQAQAWGQKETTRLYALASGADTHRALINDAVEIYCRERIPHLKHGAKQLKEFARFMWLYDGRYIDELPEVSREYQENPIGEYDEKSKKNKVLKPATIRNRLAYLRAACRYAFKHHKLCAHDPAERMTMPVVKNERHYYSDRKRVLQIARKITNRDARAAVLGAFYSGMRLGEIRRAQVTDAGFLLEDTKNGERRLIPIHRKLNVYLHRFPIKAAERTIQGCHKRACKALGVGHLVVHDLRHSAASAMINAEIDLYTVGAVLGHKTPISTKRYSHLKTETLAAAVDKIGKKVHSA